MHRGEAISRGTKGLVRTSRRTTSGLVAPAAAINRTKCRLAHSHRPGRVDPILSEFSSLRISRNYRNSLVCRLSLSRPLFVYLYGRKSVALGHMRGSTRDSRVCRHVIISDDCTPQNRTVRLLAPSSLGFTSGISLSRANRRLPRLLSRRGTSVSAVNSARRGKGDWRDSRPSGSRPRGSRAAVAASRKGCASRRRVSSRGGRGRGGEGGHARSGRRVQMNEGNTEKHETPTDCGVHVPSAR